MIRIYLILALLICLGVLSADTYKLFSSETKRETSLPKLVKALDKFDVIFFGEFHDNAVLHEMELATLKQLHKRNPDTALSLEMFERDVQSSLDNYLNGTLTFDEFMNNSRPWPNYKSDYAPMVEYAKKYKLPVIAANVPRRYASGVNSRGIEYIKSLPDSEKQFVASELVVLDDEYKVRFEETMNTNMGTAMHPKMSMNLDNLYAAQCLKDDTMAESIAAFHDKHPDTKILHVNGDFHSNSHLGTAQKLQLLRPELKIAVITPLLWKNPLKEGINQKYYEAGDFLIIIPLAE